MKLSELTNLLNKKCACKDLDIEFFAYRWDDDLEGKIDSPAWFNRISLKNGKLRILIDT